jgi:hypothetical protein
VSEVTTPRPRRRKGRLASRARMNTKTLAQQSTWPGNPRICVSSTKFGAGARSGVTLRLPIPRSPEALLLIAAHLDRFWAAVVANGHTKPTLEEEFEFLERQNEARPRA